MEAPTETITQEARQAWAEMCAKWQQEETTWPTLEEATKSYGSANQDHENASFYISELELDIDKLESELKYLPSSELPEDQRKIQADIIRDQIAGKQAEILSCEDKLVLIEQRVQRSREIYEYLLTVHNRKIQKERFPDREWPRRHSLCLGPPDEVDEVEVKQSQEDDAEMSAKWQQEDTTWPTLEEATKSYGTANQDHEKASFYISELELEIDKLQSKLRRLLSYDLPEDKKKIHGDIIRDQIAGKQAEILSCQDQLVLIEQRVQRRREIYEHLVIVHNCLFCLRPPNEVEESEKSKDDHENVSFYISELELEIKMLESKLQGLLSYDLPEDEKKQDDEPDESEESKDDVKQSQEDEAEMSAKWRQEEATNSNGTANLDHENESFYISELELEIYKLKSKLRRLLSFDLPEDKKKIQGDIIQDQVAKKQDDKPHESEKSEDELKQMQKDEAEMLTKWRQEDTTWPTLEEATKSYGTAYQDHENTSFYISELELEMDKLKSKLKHLPSSELPEDKKKIHEDIIRDQIAGKQHEILNFEGKLVLIEQRVQRTREIYLHLLAVHKHKIQKERFPVESDEGNWKNADKNVESHEDDYNNADKNEDTDVDQANELDE